MMRQTHVGKLKAREMAAFRKRLLEWYGRHKRAMPWRGTRDAYRVWVAEIMLQQTRVTTVEPYYRRFLKRFRTVRALARARMEEVLKHWAGLGYYSRARNLHQAAKEIVAKHDGRFPPGYEEALALPGVGRYTAAAVLSIAYGEPYAVLDGNVARVVARLGAMRGDLRAPGRWGALAEIAQSLMPGRESGGWRVTSRLRSGRASGERRAGLKAAPTQQGKTSAGEWNQAMMELGATVCTPRAPRCEECPVARWCKAYALGMAEQIPLARRKRARQQIEIAAAMMVDAQGRTLLVKPNGGSTNDLFSGMWQFPAVEVRRDAEKELRKHLKEVARGEWRALAPVKHSVTYREITLRPYLLRVRELPAVRGARVVRLERLGEIAVSNATRKIARAAEKGSGEKKRPWGRVSSDEERVLEI